MSTDTYYFDGNGGISDPNGKWTNDANAFNGSVPQSYPASCSGLTVGSTSSNYLQGIGNTAPSSGGAISEVRARVYVSNLNAANAAIMTSSNELLGTASGSGTGAGGPATGQWSSYQTLSTPTGGWSWSVIQALKTRIYNPSSGGYSIDVHLVEIEVTSSGAPESSERSAKIIGKSASNSERSAKTIGKSTSYSERPAKTTGQAGDVFSKQLKASLPTTDANLEPIYNTTEVSNVATDNDVFTDLDMPDTGYGIHLFKKLNANNTDKFDITVKAKSSIAPSSATVYLQVYNRNSGTWETLDSESSAGVATEFTLTGLVDSDLSYYYDANYIVAIRIYQQVA